MPKIFPPGGEVSWPVDEGVLGVIGVAPWATLDFCRVFYQEIEASKDWHYPRVLLDINTKIPSRGRHLQLGEVDPSPVIAATIRELADQGATCAVVVCNTAHLLRERWSPAAPIPVLDIVEETIKAARVTPPSPTTALVSRSLADGDLYGRAIRQAGLPFQPVQEPYQMCVDALISSVKTSGSIGAGSNASLWDLIRHLHQSMVKVVILGCTELSMLQSPLVEEGFDVVDSNRALARAALNRILPSKRIS